MPFLKASHLPLLCALRFSRAEQSLARSCQSLSWGCPREAGKELKEQWMSDVVCKVKSKWPRKKWESINGNKYKSARKNNKLSKDDFFDCEFPTGISTSSTAISHAWSARMALSQLLEPKFRNPDQCYSKESKLTLRLSILFVFQLPPFTREKKWCLSWVQEFDSHT